MEALQNKNAETAGRATNLAARELTGDDGNFVVTTDLGNEFATLDRELPAEAVHRTKRPEDRNAIAVVDRGMQTLYVNMFEGPVTGNIPEVLDNGEVTDGTHVTAGQLALALTPYAQVTDLAVNTAASGNNAAAIQSLDARVDSSALAPATAPLATAAATDGQVAAHGRAR